jgi:hypothetical protein
MRPSIFLKPVNRKTADQVQRNTALDIGARCATIPSSGGVEDVVLMRILAAGEPFRLKNSARAHNRERLEAFQNHYGLLYVRPNWFR